MLLWFHHQCASCWWCTAREEGVAHAREMHTEEARLVFIETDMSSLGAYIICMRYVSYLFYMVAYFYDMCTHTLYF